MSAASIAARSIPGIVLTLVFIALFIFGYVQSQEFRDVSRWFPQYVSVAGIGFGLIVLLWEFGIVRFGVRDSSEGDSRSRDDEATRSPWIGLLIQGGWFVALLVSFVLFGALIGTVIWSVLFIRFRAKLSWLIAAMFAAIAVVALFLIAAVLNLQMPSGIVIPSGDWIPNWRIRF